MAAAIASNTTEPGSASSWPRTISPPVRFGPQLELIGRRGAERVGRGEHDPVAVGDLLRRELADRRRLARRRSRRRTSTRSARPVPACSVRSASSSSSSATTSSRTSAIDLVGLGRRLFLGARRAPRRATASSWACRRRRATTPLRARPTSRRRPCGRACGRTRPRTRCACGRAGRAAAASRRLGSTTSGSAAATSTSGDAVPRAALRVPRPSASGSRAWFDRAAGLRRGGRFAARHPAAPVARPDGADASADAAADQHDGGDDDDDHDDHAARLPRRLRTVASIIRPATGRRLADTIPAASSAA